MATTAQLISFLRDCYEADNRETGIPNLLHSKYRHVTFLSGEDAILGGLLPRVPIDQRAAEEAQKEAHLYRRDKTLIFAALMIAGPGSSASRLAKRLCAPLVFFPSELVHSNDVLMLEPRLDDPQLNLPVITALAGDRASADIDTLQQDLPQLPWDRTAVHSAAAVLAELLPQVDFIPVANYPQLVNHPEVRQAVAGGDKLVCLPACALALIPNSPDTRGVLFELSELATAADYSEALQAVFKPNASTPTLSRGDHVPPVPTILSAAQQRVLHSARVNALTFLNGPPGTGKSYTIAAVALDHLSRGETVLIASRTNQAVDVVAEKIEGLMGAADSIVRAGRKEHLRQLKRSLERLLSGIRMRTDQRTQTARSCRRELKRLDAKVASMERTILEQLHRHVVWGQLHETAPLTWFQRITGGVRKRLLDFQLDHSPTTWKLLDSYRQLLAQRIDVTRRLLRATLDERVDRLLKRRRKDLNSFLQAIRARGDIKQQRLFAEVDFRVLLHAFPVWLSKISDLTNVLPHTCELFDVAIIDEATQCDMASALPLLQRAKRVIVAGDPKQLRHVSFLSDQRQQVFANEHELDIGQQERFHFRNKSVLDAVQQSITAQDNVVFLDEHYRSLPQIIQFSNNEFYLGALHVMRQRPATERTDAVQIRYVPGKRSESGINSEEALAILNELKLLIDQQQNRSASQCQSIGILSPFRDQVDYLIAQINQSFTHVEMERHDILVGTAHAFQGEERDVMLLSFVADRDSHAATFRFLATPNVFNVSITRARHRQIVFTSLTAAETPRDSLLRRYFASISHAGRMESRDSQLRDSFRDEVIAALSAREFEAWTDYPVAGLTMDLIVQSPAGDTFGIDLVGFPGTTADAYSLERYRMIERAGMRVIPMAYREWQQSAEDCIAPLLAKQ